MTTKKLLTTDLLDFLASHTNKIEEASKLTGIPSEVIKKELIKRDPNVIYNLGEEIDASYVSDTDIILFPGLVNMISNPTKQQRLIAITNNPNFIMKIKNPTEDEIIKALELKPTLINRLNKPNYQMKLAAIKAAPYLIDEVEVDESLILIALELANVSNLIRKKDYSGKIIEKLMDMEISASVIRSIKEFFIEHYNELLSDDTIFKVVSKYPELADKVVLSDNIYKRLLLEVPDMPLRINNPSLELGKFALDLDIKNKYKLTGKIPEELYKKLLKEEPELVFDCEITNPSKELVEFAINLDRELVRTFSYFDDEVASIIGEAKRKENLFNSLTRFLEEENLSFEDIQYVYTSVGCIKKEDVKKVFEEFRYNPDSCLYTILPELSLTVVHSRGFIKLMHDHDSEDYSVYEYWKLFENPVFSGPTISSLDDANEKVNEKISKYSKRYDGTYRLNYEDDDYEEDEEEYF